MEEKSKLSEDIMFKFILKDIQRLLEYHMSYTQAEMRTQRIKEIIDEQRAPTIGK